MPRSILKSVRPKPAHARARGNNAFLLFCLAVTSLSVLALAVLLITIFFQGTRSLLGFQVLVLPTTENAEQITVEPDRQRIRFTYEPQPNTTATDRNAKGRAEPSPPDTAYVFAPVDADLTDAAITRDGDAALLDIPGRRPIRVGDSGSLLNRLAIVGGLDPSQPADFITADPSLTPSKTGFRAPLVGSLWLLAVCAAAAIPLGVGTAIFLEEFSPKAKPLRVLHALVQTNIRNLAGVPSVVYGLIGLTAFARMFGLFGAPGQFTEFERITLDDGQRVVGQIVEDRDQRTYAITTDFFGTIRFDANDAEITNPPEENQPVALTGTIDLNDNFEFVISTDQAGTLTLDAARASDLDQSQLFATPFETRPLENAELAFVGAGELVVQTPDQGLVTIDKTLIEDPVEDRDRFLVRKHTYTLARDARLTRITPTREGEPKTETIQPPPARTISASTIELDSNTVTLFPDGRTGTGLRFDQSDIRDYHPTRRLTIGDEDSPLFVAFPFGTSVIAGGLTLMLVILPVIIIASQESLRAVPDSHREGALALGSTRLQMIFRMTLPAATPGIMTGTILSMSRAIGEAAPILIIGGAGFVTFTPENLMSGFAAMPLQIYSWTSQADREFQLVAASGIIVLLTVLFLFNATAVLIRAKLQKNLV